MPYVNTYEEIGEQETLDRLVARTITSFTDDRVHYLGINSFSNCTALEELHLPKCYYLYQDSLTNTKNLKRIILDLNTGIPCGVGNNTIINTNSARVIIYVPDELVSVYKDPQTTRFYNGIGNTDNSYKNFWSDFADRIYGISQIGGTQEWLEQEITDSWETIGAHISAGDATETYHLGMYKPVNLGSEGTINFQIVGFNQDTISGTNSTAQLTWCAMKPLATKQLMNPAADGDTMGTGQNSGWPYCSLRTYLSNTILPLFPSSVSTLIKTVDKVSKVYDPTIEEEDKFVDVSSVDKLFLFSRREVCYSGDSANENSGPKYILGFAANGARIRTGRSGDGVTWWLRTVSRGGVNYYWCVSVIGGGTTESSPLNMDVIFGFCT